MQAPNLASVLKISPQSIAGGVAARALRAQSAPSGLSPVRFTLHYLEDTAVLFDAARQSLYELNATAAYIWSCLEQAMPRPQIVSNLRAMFGFPTAAAEAHVLDVLASRHRLSPVVTPAVPDLPGRRPMRAGMNGQEESLCAVSIDLRLLDTTIRLRCGPGAPADELARAFRLLRVGPGASRLGPARLVPAAIVAELTVSGECFALRMDDAITDRCWHVDQVLPMVRARLVEAALRLSRDLFAVHAAAVSRGRSCIMLPGPSGSGKGTLAAALVAEGFRLLGDETVVLTRHSLRIRPMALPICLKDGSRRLPAARSARYVVPPSDDGVPRRSVSAIVFPCRMAQRTAELAPLARPEALTRLVRGLCPLGAAMNAETVERFARWIEDIACFELRYADLDEGVARVRELCA